MFLQFRKHKNGKGGIWHARYYGKKPTARTRAGSQEPTAQGAFAWLSRSTGTANKAEATRIGMQWEKEAAQELDGLANPHEHKYRTAETRPIAEHIAAYALHQEVQGCCPLYIKQAQKILTEFCATTGVFSLLDVDIDRYNQYLGARAKKGNSTHTCNYVTAVLKSFTVYLVDSHKSRHNPFERVKKQKNITVSKRQARAMTELEVAWLIKATHEQHDPHARLMTPERRAYMYLLAVTTGLRAGELCSLTKASFDWSARTCTVEAAYSKNREKSVQALSADVAAGLRDFVAKYEDGVKLFNGAKGQTPKLIDHDMVAAREAYIKAGETDAQKAARAMSDFLKKRNSKNQVLHFHALRHTYVTLMRKVGVDPKVCQTMARHSDIKLTMGIYDHVLADELMAAAPKMPRMS